MNVPRTPRLLVLIAGTLAFLAPEAADSQEPDPNVSVTARPRPDFDPLGIRAGGFLIYPNVALDTTYNSNVYATKNDEKDDVIFTARPSISIQSNFPRHSLNWTLATDVGRYVDQTDENFWDYGTRVGGRLDITRNNRLTGSARFGRNHESRDDPEDPGADQSRRPVRFFDYGGTLGFQQEFNRFNFGINGAFDRRDYRETNPDNPEDDRDRNLFGGDVRTGYFISPRINAFLLGGFRREQRDASNKSGRDNNVYGVGIGTAIDITGILFGEVAVGWEKQEFDESDRGSNDDFAYRADLTWDPTGLTSVRLDGSGGFVPSDVGSSNIQNRIGLRVDHELLRNLLIGGGVTYTRDDFQDTNRTDNRFDVGPGITYLINRHFSVGANYTSTIRNSDDSDREFDRHLVTLRVNAQL